MPGPESCQGSALSHAQCVLYLSTMCVWSNDNPSIAVHSGHLNFLRGVTCTGGRKDEYQSGTYLNLITASTRIKNNNNLFSNLYTQTSIKHPSIQTTVSSTRPLNPSICLSCTREFSVGVMDNTGTRTCKCAPVKQHHSDVFLRLSPNSHPSGLSFPKALQPSSLCLVRVLKMPPSLPSSHTFHYYGTFGESHSC